MRSDKKCCLLGSLNISKTESYSFKNWRLFVPQLAEVELALSQQNRPNLQSELFLIRDDIFCQLFFSSRMYITLFLSVVI